METDIHYIGLKADEWIVYWSLLASWHLKINEAVIKACAEGRHSALPAIGRKL
jgi:hypothetical protein